MENKRRDFLKTACAPVVMTVLGIPLIEACSTEENPGDNGGVNPGDPTNTVVTIDLNDNNFSSLTDIGGWMNYTEEQLLLIRISDTQIRAFDNRCPHQGNRDGWTFDGQEFNCSYHNNSYLNSCSGGLTCYSSSINDDILTVTK